MMIFTNIPRWPTTGEAMNILLLFLLVATVSVRVTANPDYSINVWISTVGTNVTYTSDQGPSSLDEIQGLARKIVALDPSQTVHLIADEKTTMASLFTLSKTICNAGLTNIVASVGIDAKASQQSNGIIQMKGMSLDIHDVYDLELEEIKSVQQPVPGHQPQETEDEFDRALQANWAQVPESDFPPPTTTPYDGNASRRNQYLKGYADGVRELLRQHKEGKLIFGDRLPPTEDERPYSNGETAGSLAVAARSGGIIEAVTKEQTDKWKYVPTK